MPKPKQQGNPKSRVWKTAGRFGVLRPGISLMFGLCFSGISTLLAADPAPNPEQRIEKPKPLSFEERRARLEEMRTRNPEAFEKLREELKDLPPAERQRRLREFREKQGLPLAGEVEKRREEFQKLTPEEREAKLKELRERMAERRKAMTPDERKVKRTEIKSRFDKQLRELEKKKANGSITAPESKRLERLGVIEQRFKQAEEHAGGIAKPATP